MNRIAEALRIPPTGIDQPDPQSHRPQWDVRFVTGVVGGVGRHFQAPITAQDDAPPRFLEALRTQLGLTLRSTRGAVDILVVDHVERPTDN